MKKTAKPGSMTKKLGSDLPFFLGFGSVAAIYIGLIAALVVANLAVVDPESIRAVWQDSNLQASIRLTLLTCSITAILAVLFATPIGYLLSRFRFPGRNLVDTMIDIPIVIPPLVVGLSLLILFNRIDFIPGGAGNSESWISLEKWLHQNGMAVTFSVPAIILAQFAVATAFAVRLTKNTFDQIDPRCEQVGLTLGCNRSAAFWRIALPQAGQGVVAAGVLAWARALGEFGPILVFAGATRGRTEVLATSVFLEINIGNLSGAAAISLLMIGLALLLISFVRFFTRSRSVVL